MRSNPRAVAGSGGGIHQPAQVAGMAATLTQSPSPAAADMLPAVRLEVRHGKGASTSYTVSEAGFIIGSVPGCDLRVPGRDLPAVICLITRQPGHVIFRKLAPTQAVLLNGAAASNGPLRHGDRIAVGAIELAVHIDAAQTAPPADAAHATGSDGGRPQLQQQIVHFRAQVVRLEKERRAQAQALTARAADLEPAQ